MTKATGSRSPGEHKRDRGEILPFFNDLRSLCRCVCAAFDAVFRYW